MCNEKFNVLLRNLWNRPIRSLPKSGVEVILNLLTENGLGIFERYYFIVFAELPDFLRKHQGTLLIGFTGGVAALTVGLGLRFNGLISQHFRVFIGIRLSGRARGVHHHQSVVRQKRYGTGFAVNILKLRLVLNDGQESHVVTGHIRNGLFNHVHRADGRHLV